MNINERVKNIKEVINNSNLATKDGELTNLHDNVVESIAKDIIKSEALITAENEEKKREYKKYLRDKNDFEALLNNKFGSFLVLVQVVSLLLLLLK